MIPMPLLAIRLGTPILIVVAAGIGYLIAGHSAHANPSEATNHADAAGLRDYPNWTGVGSCASSACHNGNYNQGNKDEVYAKQCEYSVWILKDPHQKAYSVLLSDIAHNIERNYRRLSPDAEVRAERDEVCLRCHVDPSIAKGPTSAAETPVWFQDGVGCESCHGPAKNWLAEHVSIDWKLRDRASQTKTGFKYTKSLRITAETCLQCHVGSPRCESGHDLLAAGHPRLNFDFSLAMAHYPKHWSDQEDHERYPDYAAQTWAIGSTVVAKAAFEQMAFHTSDERPWPEFADHDCYACHHDLKSESWRQTRAPYAGRNPGAVPMNSWYAAMATLPSGANPNIDEAVKTLSLEMDKTPPDRLTVRKQAKEIARLLGEHASRIEDWHFDESKLKALYTAVAADPDNQYRQNWDNAAEIYLALAALEQSRLDLNPALRDPVGLKWLDDMDRILGIGRQRPPEVHFASPRDYLPDAFGKALRELQSAAGK